MGNGDGHQGQEVSPWVVVQKTRRPRKAKDGGVQQNSGSRFQVLHSVSGRDDGVPPQQDDRNVAATRVSTDEGPTRTGQDTGKGPRQNKASNTVGGGRTVHGPKVGSNGTMETHNGNGEEA